MNGFRRVVSIYALYGVLVITLIGAIGLQSTLITVTSMFLFRFIIACIQFPTLRRNLRHVDVRGRGGYLYSFTDRGLLVPVQKVGRATTLDSRLSQHRTSAAFGILIWFAFEVPDAVAAEAYLHYRWRSTRIRTSAEWFYFSIGTLSEVILLSIFGA